MSRTYRRKITNQNRSIHRGFWYSENEYINGGYVHGGLLNETLDYHVYQAREKAFYHSDGVQTYHRNAPSRFCNQFNRQERYYGRKQLKPQLFIDYEDIDVQKRHGPYSATWFWW